jgi:hypothetical protein
MGSKKQRNAPTPPIQIPLYIPTEDGYGELVLGTGEMRGSTLVINFSDLIPAAAIKHRIERGGIVGITFVIPEDEGAIHKENEDAIQAAQDAAREAKAIADGEEIPLSDRDVRDLALLETLEPDDKV